jgi:hypothetical protein
MPMLLESGLSQTSAGRIVARRRVEFMSPADRQPQARHRQFAVLGIA